MSHMPRPRLFLIDGSSQMYRAYHAMRGGGLSNQQGSTTHAVYLFVTFATPWRQEIAAVDSAMRFILCFFLGGAFYLYADKIRLDWRIAVALGLAAVLALGTGAFETVSKLALAYGVLWFALVPGGFIRRFNRIGPTSVPFPILCAHTVAECKHETIAFVAFLYSIGVVLPGGSEQIRDIDALKQYGLDISNQLMGRGGQGTWLARFSIEEKKIWLRQKEHLQMERRQMIERDS